MLSFLLLWLFLSLHSHILLQWSVYVPVVALSSPLSWKFFCWGRWCFPHICNLAITLSITQYKKISPYFPHYGVCELYHVVLCCAPTAQLYVVALDLSSFLITCICLSFLHAKNALRACSPSLQRVNTQYPPPNLTYFSPTGPQNNLIIAILQVIKVKLSRVIMTCPSHAYNWIFLTPNSHLLTLYLKAFFNCVSSFI